ncbi:hypothetical protein F4859DRAFT_508418 [Xylaria cf. heliscus]|nr:hypothetical protein F4859DRAFT_508418 [Xylaria cf. heliscus]
MFALSEESKERIGKIIEISKRLPAIDPLSRCALNPFFELPSLRPFASSTAARRYSTYPNSSFHTQATPAAILVLPLSGTSPFDPRSLLLAAKKPAHTLSDYSPLFTKSGFKDDHTMGRRVHYMIYAKQSSV